MKTENKGVVLTLVSAALWGAYPVFANSRIKDIPEFTFAAVLAVFITIAMGIWIVATGKIKELRQTRTYFTLLMVSLFIVIIPYLIFFAGIKYTSGINSSALMLSEMIFTLIFTPFFGERNTTEKYIGAIGITLGAFLVLFDGNQLSFNIGDFLIIISTITNPFGNFYSKRALYDLSPSTVIFARYLIASIFLLIFSSIVEPEANLVEIATDNFSTFAFIGVGLVTGSTLIYYEAMKLLDISKLISLTMTYPLFSLVALLCFFDTQVNIYQFIGILVMVIGAFYAVRRQSEQPSKLKYKPRE